MVAKDFVETTHLTFQRHLQIAPDMCKLYQSHSIKASNSTIEWKRLRSKFAPLLEPGYIASSELWSGEQRVGDVFRFNVSWQNQGFERCVNRCRWWPFGALFCEVSMVFWEFQWVALLLLMLSKIVLPPSFECWVSSLLMQEYAYKPQKCKGDAWVRLTFCMQVMLLHQLRIMIRNSPPQKNHVPDDTEHCDQNHWLH